MPDPEKHKREQLLLIRKHTMRALAELAAARDAATGYRLPQGGFLHIDDSDIAAYISNAVSRIHLVNRKLDAQLSNRE